MQRVVDNLTTAIRNGVLQQVSLFTDKYYRFDVRHSKLTACDKPGRFCVIGRRHYSEEVVWYPIVKRADVLKIAQLKKQQASMPVVFYIGKPVADKTPVSYFHFSLSKDKMPSSFVMPESLLLGFGLDLQPQQVLGYREPGSSRQVFVLRSQAGYESAFAGGAFIDEQHFALAYGVIDADIIALSEAEYCQGLLSGLWQFRNWASLGLVKAARDTVRFDFSRFQPYLLATLAAVTAYLLITVQLADWRSHNAQSRLQVKLSEANQVLSKRKDIAVMTERYQLLSDLVPEQGRFVALWEVLAPVFSEDVEFQNIDLLDNQYRIRFEAESATDVLQQLMQHPQVQGAGFDAPVRRNRDKDRASIVFQLNTASEAGG